METGPEPVRRPVPRPISFFNILNKETHKTVAYTEDRILPKPPSINPLCIAKKPLSLGRFFYVYIFHVVILEPR